MIGSSRISLAVIGLFSLITLGISLLILPESMTTTLPKLFALVLGSGIISLVLSYGMLRSGLTAPVGTVTTMILLLGAVLYSMSRVLHVPLTAMGLNRMLILLSCTCVFCAIVLTAGNRWKNMILGALLVSSIPALLLSLALGFGLLDWIPPSGAGTARNSGTLGNANLLSSFAAAILLPGLLFLGSVKIKRYRRIMLMLVLGLLCATILIQSGTRSSMVALLAAAVLTTGVVLKKSSKRPMLRRGLLVSVLVVLLPVLVSGPLLSDRLREFSLSSSTLGVRRVIWDGTIGMFKARPLDGWGDGSFQTVFPVFRPADYSLHGVSSNTAHAHSEVLELAAESGVIGLLIWGILAALWFRTVLMRRKEWTAVDLGAFAGVVFLLVESVVSVSLRWTSSAFLLAVLAAIPLIRTDTEGKQLPRIASVLPLISAVLLLGFGVPTVWKMMQSSRFLYSAKEVCLEGSMLVLSDPQANPSTAREQALGLCRLAVDECHRSIELCPWELGSWFTMGNAYLTEANVLALEYPSAPAAVAAGITVDTRGAERAVQSALEAFDSLAARAPDFVDLRLNRIHAYSKLGMYDETMEDLLYLGNRRTHLREYCRMVAHWIAPFTTGYHIGISDVGVVTSIVSDQYSPTIPCRDLTDDRKEEIAEGLLVYLALVGFDSPESTDTIASVLADCLDTTADEFRDQVRHGMEIELEVILDAPTVMNSYQTGDWDGLYDHCSQIVNGTEAYALYHRYVLCRLAHDRGDSGAAGILADLSGKLRDFGIHRILAWPGKGDHLIMGVEMALRGDPTNIALLQQMFDDALCIDSYLFSALRFVQSNYLQDGGSVMVDSVLQFWVGIGGPLASEITGLRGDLLLVPEGIIERMYYAVQTASMTYPDSLELKSFLLEQQFRLGCADTGYN